MVSAAPEVPRPPVPVVQRLPRLNRARLVLSEDGALLAVLGTSLTLVSTADGSVRGAFPRCVVDATFGPDEESMIVVGCPERALSPAEAPRTSATTKIWRWDLRRDEVTALAEGPFEHVRTMPNPDEVLLWGRDRVAAARLRDGALRTTLTATGTKRNELMQVSRSGTRAFASVDSEAGLIDERGFRKGYYAGLSPELDLTGEVRAKRLDVKRTNDGASVLSIELPKGEKFLGFDPPGERFALLTAGDKGRRDLTFMERSEKKFCSVPGSFVFDTPLVWSKDGQKVLIIDGRDRKVVRTSDCQEIGRPAIDLWGPLVGNGALDLVALEEKDRGVELQMVDAGGSAVRSVRIPSEEPATFVGQFQDLFVIQVPDHSRVVFDAKSNRTVEGPSSEAIETVAGRLHTMDARGEITLVTDRVPYDAVDLLLVDSSGKATKLARPSNMADLKLWGSGCEASPDRTTVRCWRNIQTFEDESWIWDRRGKLLGTFKARDVRFSSDGSRLLTIDRDKARLLEASSLREIRAQKQDGLNSVSFSPDGALVAWSTVGLVDAKSGATLWGDAGTFFNGFLPGSPLRVVTHEGDSYGPVAIRDGRTGSLIHAFVGETRVVDVSQDGTRLLLRDPDKNHHVFDSARSVEVAVLGRAEDAEISADGRFSVFDYGHGIVARRLADGAEVVFLPSHEKKTPGLAFTRDGLFDGGLEALAAVRIREGGIRDGKLRGVVASDTGYRPGLVADFWAGKPLAR